MTANISSPASGKRMLISPPTDRPPSSTMRVMGKPKPHTVATEAMMSTAVECEMADCGLCAVMKKKPRITRREAD